MGFDIHGVDPVVRGPRPERPDNLYDGHTPKDIEVRDAYFDAKMEYEDSNPGVYFRRSVWGWRPLWECVNQFTDALTDEDFKHGCYNDGHLIPKDVAVQVAADLTKALESGKVATYLKERTERIDGIPDRTCERCKGSGREPAKLEVLEGQAMQGLFGVRPEPCRSCNGSGKQQSWESMYGMDEHCVEEFRTFCAESGGFEIC